MTQEERMDRTDLQIADLKESTIELRRSTENLLKLAAENEKRWSQERQKWHRLEMALSAAFDSWAKSA